MATVHASPARSEAPSWTPCTQQGHIDELRVRHDDVASHPYDRGAQAALWEEVGELLNHLDGLHADDCAVELIVRTVSEPDRLGVWE
ncbi:MAG: hypothetical protein DLM67_26055 [Candidatus Nephthysia bennettiae]|nr:MAG: hypothetical protein DLM67_26055 [Candidatus Dormibacteraeota bacterium]